MNQSLPLFCIFLFIATATAQVDPDETFSCATEVRHEHLMRTDSTYKANFLRHTHELDSALQAASMNRSAVQVEYTIPVVVHVIHLGEPVGTGSNISDAQILAAIDGLNDRYANDNGQGVDTEIAFCLATQAPDGCPTTGILRVDGTVVTDYAAEGIEYDETCGADELMIKNLSRWSPLDYYNVWVVHDICGNWAGYAYYPNGGNLDGTVIGSTYMTAGSKTLAHELGHGLNIRHTFHGDGDGDDCPDNTTCANNGDLICDTPPHRRDDCDTSNPCTSEGIWHNSRYNWMSYCSTPVNLGRFTNDQRSRMQAAMNAFPREELQNSVGCEPIELPWITSDNDAMCEGEIRVLTAEPEGGVFYVISGPGEIQGDELTATGEGTITIQYTTCSFDVMQQIESFDTPAPFFTSSDDPMCSGTSRLLVCVPSGGDFDLITGPASLVGNTLLAEEPGSVEIEYIITLNGCTGNTFQEFIIVETPMPEITSTNEPMCEGSSRLLTGIPGGGEFAVISGAGMIDGNELTATGDGLIVIEYTVEDNECAGSTTQSILVHFSPTPSITSSNNHMCSGEERVLTGLPAGGSFSVMSGPGNINGDTLTATGTGDVIVQYTVIQNGCAGVATQTINSHDIPVASFTNPETIVCLDQSISLTAVPPGGTFAIISGPGVLHADTLTVSEEGEILIGYSVEQNSCTGYVEKQITAVVKPQPVITIDTTALCSGDARLLTAIPEGGVFAVAAGPGVIENNELIALAAGSIQIHYAVDLNGCYGDETLELLSFPTPMPALLVTGDTLCNGQFIELAGEPVGGVFETLSGPGVIIENVLSPLDTGIIEFIYTVVENNCTGSVQGEILVTPPPVADVITNEHVLTSATTDGSLQWVRCDLGYEVIDGATDATYAVSTSGSYALVVQGGTCADTSDCVDLEITSVDDGDSEGQIIIYPNPVNDVLYLEFYNSSYPLQITISDTQGKSVRVNNFNNQAKMGIDVSALAPSVYVMAIAVEGRERSYYRFIKV